MHHISGLEAKRMGRASQEKPRQQGDARHIVLLTTHNETRWYKKVALLVFQHPLKTVSIGPSPSMLIE
jgi:hypothetical protein